VKKTLALLFTLVSLNSWAKNPKQVQVQGSCQIKVTPDRGRITFTAENDSKNQKDALKKTNKQINELKEKISDLKLSHLELKNTGYYVHPIREYEKDRLVDKGMRVSLGLEVTTSEIAKIGEVIVLASDLDIKNVGQLQTFLSEKEEQKNYLRCLEIASQNAKEKAQKLANQLDFKLGGVEGIIEGAIEQTPTPMPHRGMVKSMMAFSAESAPVSNIEVGQELFSITLQVIFGIK